MPTRQTPFQDSPLSDPRSLFRWWMLWIFFCCLICIQDRKWPEFSTQWSTICDLNLACWLVSLQGYCIFTFVKQMFAGRYLKWEDEHYNVQAFRIPTHFQDLVLTYGSLGKVPWVRAHPPQMFTCLPACTSPGQQVGVLWQPLRKLLNCLSPVSPTPSPAPGLSAGGGWGGDREQPAQSLGEGAGWNGAPSPPGPPSATPDGVLGGTRLSPWGEGGLPFPTPESGLLTVAAQSCWLLLNGQRWGGRVEQSPLAS